MINRYEENSSIPKAMLGRVAASGKYILDVAGHIDLKNLDIISPYGIDAKPMEGETVVLLPLDSGGYVVLGTQGRNPYADSGEISIRSAGGAYILLKKNGEVEINGMVIGTNGMIK